MAHTNRINMAFDATQAAASINLIVDVEGNIPGMVNLDAE